MVDAVGRGVDAALGGARVWIWEAAYERPDGARPRSTRSCRHASSSSLPDVGLLRPRRLPRRTVRDRAPLPDRQRGGTAALGPGALTGRTVLVAGGAGAVGNAAIQLARWCDATVIATVSSPAKAQLAAAAGADHVINYRQQDVVAEVRKIAPQGVDTIVEVAPAANAAIDAAVLAPARRGGDLRQRRRRRVHPAGTAPDGAERALAVRAALHRARRGQGHRCRGHHGRAGSTARSASATKRAFRCTTSRWNVPATPMPRWSTARSARS